MKKTILVLGLTSLVLSASAKIEMGTPFADGMVLQRGMKVPVWGKVVPEVNTISPTVTVSFAGQTKSATTDPVTGVWKVELDPMEASKESRTMTVVEETGKWFVDLFSSPTDTVEIKDVLVGEVWFCSGQSNTEMPLVGDNPHFSDRLGRLTAQTTEKPNAWKAPSSFSPPRLTNRCSPMRSTTASAGYVLPGFDAGWLSTRIHPARMYFLACSRLSASPRSTTS